LNNIKSQGGIIVIKIFFSNKKIIYFNIYYYYKNIYEFIIKAIIELLWSNAVITNSNVILEI